MGEIATWGMIRAKVPAFPAPAANRDNECLSKSEILSLGGGNVHVEGSYGDGECVMVDNVLPVIWEYTFIVTPTSLSFGSTGGTQSVQVTSYKRKYFGSNYTGEQVDVGFSSSTSGSGFSSAGTSVSAGNNTTTSQRSGTVTFVQYESGKPGYVSCQQAAGTLRVEYTIKRVSGSGLGIIFQGNEYGVSRKRSIEIVVERRNYVNNVPISSDRVDFTLGLVTGDVGMFVLSLDNIGNNVKALSAYPKSDNISGTTFRRVVIQMKAEGIDTTNFIDCSQFYGGGLRP